MKKFLLLSTCLGLYPLSAQSQIEGKTDIEIDQEQIYSLKDAKTDGHQRYEWKVDGRHFDILSSTHQPQIKLKASLTGTSKIALGLSQNGKTEWAYLPVNISDPSLASVVYGDDHIRKQGLKSQTKLKTITRTCDIPYLFLLASDLEQSCIDFSSSVSDDSANYPHQWAITWDNDQQQVFHGQNIEVDNGQQNRIKSLKLMVNSNDCEKEISKIFPKKAP
jgi:hypothetical protein